MLLAVILARQLLNIVNIWNKDKMLMNNWYRQYCSLHILIQVQIWSNSYRSQRIRLSGCGIQINLASFWQVKGNNFFLNYFFTSPLELFKRMWGRARAEPGFLCILNDAKDICQIKSTKLKSFYLRPPLSPNICNYSTNWNYSIK